MTRQTPTTTLYDIADALPYVELLTTSRAPHSGAQGSGGTLSRPPMRLDVIDLLDTVHATLAAWVRDAHEAGHVTDADDWPADNATAMCLWLAGHDEILVHHPARREYTDEVEHLWRQVRSTIGERPPRRPHCIGSVDGQLCGNPLEGRRAPREGERPESDGSVGAEVLEQWTWCKCSACGATYTFDAALRRLGQLQRLTIPQFCAETGAVERTMRWRLQQLGIEPVGRLRGAPTYLRDDLVRVSLAAQVA